MTLLERRLMGKSRGYDLWLTAANRVYRAVPYDVLTDWLQQGRVVADDQVRTETAGELRRVADVSAPRTFLPHADVDRPDDVAGAVEPVALPVVPRRPQGVDRHGDLVPPLD